MWISHELSPQRERRLCQASVRTQCYGRCPQVRAAPRHAASSRGRAGPEAAVLTILVARPLALQSSCTSLHSTSRDQGPVFLPRVLIFASPVGERKFVTAFLLLANVCGVRSIKRSTCHGERIFTNRAGERRGPGLGPAGVCQRVVGAGDGRDLLGAQGRAAELV